MGNPFVGVQVFYKGFYVVSTCARMWIHLVHVKAHPTFDTHRSIAIERYHVGRFEHLFAIAKLMYLLIRAINVSVKSVAMSLDALDIEGIMQLQLLASLIHLVFLQLQLSKLHGLPRCGSVTSDKKDKTCCQ